MSFCKKLKRIRKVYNYSQEELAKQLGVSRTHYSNIETGKMKASDTVISCLSLLFHLPKEYLLANDDNYNAIDTSYQKFILYTQNQEATDKIIDVFCHLNKDYQDFLLLSAKALLDMQNKQPKETNCD